VQLQAETKRPALHLELLPAFAQYILTHKLEAFVRLQYRYTHEEDLELLKDVQHLNEEEKMEIGRQYNRGLLTFLAEKRAGDFIRHRMDQWLQNDVPFDKYSVIAADIPKLSFIRKRAFTELLSEYCVEGAQMLQIIGEIDRFFLHYDSASLEVYSRMLEAQAAERSLFIEKVNATLPGALYVFELQSFRNLYTNVKFAEVIGYSREELNNLGPEAIDSIVHPDDRAEVTRHLAAIRKAQDGDILSYQYRMRGKDGVYRWFRNFESVFRRDSTGLVTEIIAICLNVNAEMRMAQRLKQREEQLLEAQAIAHIGSYYWVLNEPRSTGTPELAAILEINPENHSEFLERIHPDDRARMEADIQKAFQSGVFESEYRYLGKEGQKYLWSRGVVHYRDGEPHAISGTVMDITDRKDLQRQAEDAERRIEEQDYFIQHLADASPMVLYLFDIPSGRFRYLNREIFYVLGYTPEEVLAMDAETVSGLYHPDDRLLLPERTGSESHFKYQESMMQYECRLRKKDGDWYWLLAREVVFRKDDKGAVQQILGAALDINRRKDMERTLLQNSFQLEQSNASLEEFAYVASHDLKEPLRKISTFGDRLVAFQKENLSDDGKIYLKKIVEASQRMQIMIDELLSVSRIAGNHSFERVSLNELLNDAQQALEFKIEQHGARIIADELPEAEVVPSQFRQLFQNLLSNSLKFAREGVTPEIHVHYRYLRPGDVEDLQLRKAASYLELTFRDNGIGFENEYSGKIFQIFQRLHGRSEYEGNGIGLAIVKKIVEHHGGSIAADGDPGKGAVFTLTLPL
jgi:PAS domain S-box-containing protein